MIDKETIWYKHFANLLPQHDIKAAAYPAMDEHAKNIAIGFAEWCEKSGYELWDDEGNGVWFDIGESGNRTKKFTSEQLFQSYLNTLIQ